MRKIWLLSGGVLIIVLQCFSGVALASSSSPSSGLQVSPAISESQLVPNQSLVTLDQTVTNISSQPLLISLKPQDFGSFGLSGSVNLYTTSNYNPSNNPHGLQNSIRFNTSQFTLQPHVSQTVAVSIVNALSLAAGGHYGAVIYTPSVINGGSNPSKVSLIPTVASLIFIITAGGGTQHLSLTNILQNELSFSLPKTTSFIMANSGNTQSDPTGYISLIGPGDHLLAQSVINNTSSLVLPSSSVLMSVNLHESTSFFTWPGIYHLKIVYGYSGSTKQTIVQRNFIFLNLPLLVAIILILVIVFWVIKRRKHRHKGKL